MSYRPIVLVSRPAAAIARQVSQSCSQWQSERWLAGPMPTLLPWLLLLSLLVAGCEPAPAPPDPAELIRPVRVLMVEPAAGGERVTLTGKIEAQDEVRLAFRIAGRMLERNFNVGDQVSGGEVVARLDPQTWREALTTARANLTAARARLVETRNQFERFETLIQDGFITRAMFDQAEQAFRSAEAQVSSAEAQVRIAETELSYTELLADGPGVVTARGAEPGEVVAAGQMILTLAREGGRDAVIDVPIRIMQRAPSGLPIEVSLTEDPAVRAQGLVREVAPQADPLTRTFRVRVGLIDSPPALRLGSTITATAILGEDVGGLLIPASALTTSLGQPAVWVLDPDSMTVELRNVAVTRYDLAQVAIAHGLAIGETIVTAGVQTLRPGQQVRLAAGIPLPAEAPAADQDADVGTQPPPGSDATMAPDAAPQADAPEAVPEDAPEAAPEGAGQDADLTPDVGVSQALAVLRRVASRPDRGAPDRWDAAR